CQGGLDAFQSGQRRVVGGMRSTRPGDGSALQVAGQMIQFAHQHAHGWMRETFCQWLKRCGCIGHCGLLFPIFAFLVRLYLTAADRSYHPAFLPISFSLSWWRVPTLTRATPLLYSGTGLTPCSGVAVEHISWGKVDRWIRQ